MRNFNIADYLVIRQLRNLERLAAIDCNDGDYRTVDTLISAVISGLQVLPNVIRARIRVNLELGDSHYNSSNSGRVKIWSRLASELGRYLDALAADADLELVDLSERPKTKGEAICEVCSDLEAARQGGRDMLPLARKLKIVGSGTAAARDGEQLENLLTKKNIPDMSIHRDQVVRLIQHAKIVSYHWHCTVAELQILQ